MGTLDRFGLRPMAAPGTGLEQAPAKPVPGKTRRNASSEQAEQGSRVFSPNQLHANPCTRIHPDSHGAYNIPVQPVQPVPNQQTRGFFRNRLDSKPAPDGPEPVHAPNDEHDRWLAGTPVAELARPRHGPAPGSFPARVIEAGGWTSVGSRRYRTAYLPAGHEELVQELRGAGWCVVISNEAKAR